MTPEQINQAIAEHCGWERVPLGSQPKGDTEPRGWLPPNSKGNWAKALHHGPNYCADLNAMHEAEETFLSGYDPHNPNDTISKEWETYCYWLAHLTPLGIQNHATAHQRAEAFLRTVGKWREEPRKEAKP